MFLTLNIALLQSPAFADCNDESNISDEYSFVKIWCLVCVFDGIAYSNDCYVENAGFIDSDKGECS